MVTLPIVQGVGEYLVTKSFSSGSVRRWSIDPVAAFQR